MYRVVQLSRLLRKREVPASWDDAALLESVKLLIGGGRDISVVINWRLKPHDVVFEAHFDEVTN